MESANASTTLRVKTASDVWIYSMIGLLVNKLKIKMQECEVGIYFFEKGHGRLPKMTRQTSAEGVSVIIMQAHATLIPICTAEQTIQLAEFVDAWTTLTEQIVKNAFQGFSETLTCHSTTHYLVEVRYSSEKIIKFLYKYQLLYW